MEYNIPFPTRMDLCVSVSTILTREKSPNNKWKNFSQLIPAFRHPQPYPCANVNAFPPLQVVVFYYNFDIITSYVRRFLFMKMHHLSHLELFTLSGSGSLSLCLFVYLLPLQLHIIRWNIIQFRPFQSVLVTLTPSLSISSTSFPISSGTEYIAIIA